jgi:ubiquinone biosynthesis protein UbiJ
MSGTTHEQARAVPGFGFKPPAAAALNHLLRSASWARERLHPFAGKIARFELVPFTTTLAILDSGEVADAPAAATPDASFTLTPGVALRMLAGDADAWQKVAGTGDAALAREILYIAQNLRWDAEEDLSRVCGDIAAHRMVGAANEIRRWQRDTADNFARALSAYWTEERPLIAARPDVERFVRAVDHLRDDVARLEKRLDQLARKDAGR